VCAPGIGFDVVAWVASTPEFSCKKVRRHVKPSWRVGRRVRAERIGERAQAVVLRDGRRVTLGVIPDESRQPARRGFAAVRAR